MLYGQMMDRSLMVSNIIEYAAEIHPDVEIVSSRVEGDRHRYTFVGARNRAAQLAHALKALGIEMSDRVATLGWNGHRHLELYYAISGIGAVCHTINPRLFQDQLVYIINHAEDRILFLEASFVGLIEPLLDRLPKNLRYVIMTSREHMPETSLPDPLCFEELLDGQPERYDWPEFDERAASSLCYTSGTTGNPKGVLYSHRSTLLHTMGLMSFGHAVGLTPEHTLLPVVPLFHVNAWGLPYAVPIMGPKFVLPGPRLDGASLFDLMDEEAVTAAWGVPTVWLGLLEEMRKRGRKPKAFEMVMVGGSALPEPMIREFRSDWGVEPFHGWGMTEISPVGSIGNFEQSHKKLDEEAQIDLKMTQGRRVFGVNLKIVDEDGKRLPHDGEAFGELLVSSPTSMSGYYNDEAASAQAFDEEGWMRTGDVAKISPDGFLQLVDRTKDVIKSGGEWISSIDLENAALGHPAIAECAVIAAYHPKWAERPLLVVQLVEGQSASAEEIVDYLRDKVVKWWLPDDVVFVDKLPHTATGKLSKLTLREQFKDHILPTAKD